MIPPSTQQCTVDIKMIPPSPQQCTVDRKNDPSFHSTMYC